MKTRHRHKRTKNKSKKRGGGFFNSLFRRKSPIASKAPNRLINMTFESPVNINSRFKASSTLLGKGGFGTVKLVNGRVVKKLSINEDEAEINKVKKTKSESFAKELELTKMAASNNNPYVSTYEEISTKSNKAKYLSLEKMAVVNNQGFSEHGSELFKALAHNKITIENVKEIIIELLKGLDSIHDRDILHLDIKHNNIWVFPDNRKIRYFDFGLSCHMNKDNKSCVKELEGTEGFIKDLYGKYHEAELHNDKVTYNVTDDFYALAQTIKIITDSIIWQIVSNTSPTNKNPTIKRLRFLYNQYNQLGQPARMIPDLIEEIDNPIFKSTMIFINTVMNNLLKLTVNQKAIDAIPRENNNNLTL